MCEVTNPRPVNPEFSGGEKERKMKTTIEILTQVSGFIPTVGLVFTMSRCMGVYTSRPMLFISEIAAPVMEQSLRQAA
jgi:hypothetical protein